jgi:hypothetical protein
VRRQDLEFAVGDQVLLRVSPTKGVVRFGVSGKHNPRYIGPFTILARVGSLAYRLCRRFETGGSLRPTSECRVPQPRWVERVGKREGGKGARRPETGVREVGIPRPSCSTRAQVGCACSRGLQASTRVREASGPKRAPVPSSSRAANPL